MPKRSGIKIHDRILSLLALALVCALILPSCSGRRRTEPEATPEPSPTVSATEEPTAGGMLRLPMPVNAPHNDPLLVTTEEMLYLFSLVYDSLLTVGPNLELEPCLCESWTSVSPGVWELHLREGVSWHDGTPFTAKDVVNTYEALLSLPESYYRPCLAHILSVEMTGTYTILLRLDTPGISGLYSLVFPIRKKTMLVGTGAYRLERMTDEQVFLIVNRNWWDKLPYITRVVFSERDSNTTALASYEAGQLDMVPTDILTAGKYYDEGKTNVQDVMTQDMEALLFNLRSSVFTDTRLRLAVAHGINRSPIITNVYSNRARAADVPFPPDSWLYDSRCDVLNYDPGAAAQLISDAGYTIVSNEDGLLYSAGGRSLSVKLLTSATTENTVRSEAANMIASQLANLGFAVEVVAKPHTLGDSESEFMAALRGGDWDVALVGFNLSAGNDLTSYLAPDGANNFGGIRDSQLLALAADLNVSESEEIMRERAFAFQSYFVENAPFLSLYFRLNSVIYSADLAGVGVPREPLLLAGEKNWYFKNE